MVTQTININNNHSQEVDNRADKIITMGEIIGMIRMVLTSIIEAMDKSGDVGGNYLQTNLKAMRDSASHAKSAQIIKAAGATAAAIIGITIAVVGMGAAVGSIRNIGKNTTEMNKIQSAPLTQPAKNVPPGPGNSIGSVHANRVRSQSMSDIQESSRAFSDGKKFEISSAPSKQKEPISKMEAPHAKEKNATSYSSEAEREKAFKTQEEANKANTWASLLGFINPQVLQLGNIEQARAETKAADKEYVSSTERAGSEVVRTLQSENGNFYGSLGGLLDKLGITNLITQTLIAASQWR